MSATPEEIPVTVMIEAVVLSIGRPDILAIFELLDVHCASTA
jgi:hypothetical protein